MNNLTLTGSVEVDVNGSSSSSTPVVDFSQFPGNSLSIPTGTGQTPVNLDFATKLFQATGNLTLSVGSFAILSGDFSFQEGPTQTVTIGQTTPATTEEVSTLEVGISNVYGFAGENGPYWVMGADGWIRGPTADSALGVVLSDASLGLALMKPVPTTADPSPTISYLALAATGSVQFVGIPDVTLAANNLSIEVNQASDTSNPNGDTPPVNLIASPLSVPTDSNPADNVPLNFAAGSVLEAQGTASITISQFVSITGSIAIQQGGAPQSLTLSDNSEDHQPLAFDHRSQWRLCIRGRRRAVLGHRPRRLDPGAGRFGRGRRGPLQRDVRTGALPGTSGGNTENFYALNGTVGGISLVGVSDVTLSAANLSLDVNGSSGVADNAVVNFDATYPAVGNTPAGLAINNGSTTPTVIDDKTAELIASARM